MGEQLRAQGQTTPALVMDVVAEKLEPVSGYLNSTDPDKLKSDVAAYRAKVQQQASTGTDAIDRKQKAAAKATVTRVKNKPALPILGAVSVLAIVATRVRKSRKQQSLGQGAGQPTDAQVDSGFGVAEYSVESPAQSPVESPVELSNMSRSQLRDQAAAAEINVSDEMSKAELITAIQGY